MSYPVHHDFGKREINIRNEIYFNLFYVVLLRTENLCIN